jgi:hypothetical protein
VHSSEVRLDGEWFRNIGFASALPDFFGDHRNMTQMFASLRDLKSGNVGQLNIHQYEIGFVHAISSASTPLQLSKRSDRNFASQELGSARRTLTRPLSKKEGYDHRIPMAMARIQPTVL